MLKNRVHAVLHQRGILPPAQGLFTQTGRGFLTQIPQDEGGRYPQSVSECGLYYDLLALFETFILLEALNYLLSK